MSRKLFLPFLLILLVQAVFSQTTATKTETEKADELKKQAVELLRETSQDVGNLRTLENRISFSAEIAALMWFHDEKEARTMYQTTINDFRELLSQIETQYNSLDAAEQTEDSTDDFIFGGGTGSKAIVMRKFMKAMSVRQQIALSIAEHDPQMGYDFFTGTAQAFTNPQLVSQVAGRDTYIELKLLDLMAEKDVDKALEAGRKLLAKGKTFELLGLLRKIYDKDDEKGAAFGEEILSKMKASDSTRADGYYYYSSILNLGVENLEKIKDTPDKKPLFSRDSLRQIADLFAQEILTRDFADLTQLESSIALIEKFSPARATQIRLKFKDTKKPETASVSSMEVRTVAANERQTENTEQQQKIAEEVKKLADKQLPKEEREKIIAQTRQIVSKIKNREQKIVALSLLASQVAGLGDKELALEIMTEARNLVTLQPKNYRDYLGVWMLVNGYAQVDSDKAFPILEDAILRLNGTISAFIKVGEFIDVNSDFIEDEEVQVGSFGGEITRGLLGNLGAADTTLSTLAKADFARTRALTNKFDRLEVRILAKMLVLRAVLGEKKTETKVLDVKTEAK